MSGGLISAFSALAKAKFDASKHRRGQGGKFEYQGGAKKPAPKAGGSVAAAHGIFDKLKHASNKEKLAAAQAAGLNPNTAKTQLYHWQKKQAVAALGGKTNPTKEDLQKAAAEALGVKQVHKPIEVKPEPKPAPKPEPKPAPKPPESKPPAPKPPEPHKGYDHISNGTGTAEQKSKKLMDEYFADVDKAKTIKEIDALQPHFDKAEIAIKKQELAEKAAAAKPPVAEPPDLAKLGPVKYTHALADHMKGSTKKEVVAAAVKAGVHPSTAGVQYGKWAKAKAGEPPQLAKSPEPAALQAKQPTAMSDKDLDKAIDSYHGKVGYKSEQAKVAPTTYKHPEEYHPSSGGKALTAKLGSNEIYTHPTQGKTFYKAVSGNIYEHTGTQAGEMKLVSGTSLGGQPFYDPATKVLYAKVDGVLKVVPGVKTPIFKNDLPYEPGNHVFKDHAWANANGIQDPTFDAGKHFNELKAVHAKAGVTYNETSQAVKSYTGSGYHAINGELRASKGQTVGTRAQAIDKLISQSSFKEDTIMWRGVGSGEGVWNGAPPPGEVTDHGFTSVSFKPSTAKNFSNGKTLFRVRVPKGFPGLNVAIGSPGSGVAGLQGEAEVMLPRGTTYKVVERHKGIGGSKYGGGAMDVVDLEPVLPDWYVKQYGQPKIG